MNFPLLLLPRRTLFIDDDAYFLDALRANIPPHEARQFSSSASVGVDTLLGELGHWRALESTLAETQHCLPDGCGALQIYANAYFNEWRRFQLTSVLVLDYAMPDLNGFAMIQRLKNWPGCKILLTGEADVHDALRAFNMGSIQQYLPKATPNLFAILKQSCANMHLAFCAQFAGLIRSTLTSEQAALLQAPGVAAGLSGLVDELGWVEYLVVGRPFGLLGMAASGPLQWVQLETPQSMLERAESCAEQGLPDEALAPIRQGIKVSGWDLSLEFPAEMPHCLVDARPVCAAPHVVAGVFNVPCRVLPSQAFGRDDINSPQEEISALARNCKAALRQVDDNLRDRRLTHVMAVSNLRRIEEGLEEAVQRLLLARGKSVSHWVAYEAALLQGIWPPALLNRLQA